MMSSHMRDDEFERLYEAEAQALFGFLAYRTGAVSYTHLTLPTTPYV